MDGIAFNRDSSVKKNKVSYHELTKFFKHDIPEQCSVLKICCGRGDIPNGVNPKRDVGIDSSRNVINIAKNRAVESITR